MNAWLLLLTPLLVLPIVTLFRFVGCSSFSGADPVDNFFRYRKYLLGDPKDVAIQKNPGVHPKKADIVGYWRLVDAEGDPAKDEVGFQNGEYKSGTALKEIAPAPPNEGSEPAPGTFLPGQTSLVKSDTLSTCRFFNGGHVVIPFKPGLYSNGFTIEAWIDAQWTMGKEKFGHTLFSAGGFFRAPFAPSEAYHGFSLFVNGENRWDATVLPHGSPLFSSQLPLIPRPGPTHVALTVAAPDPVTRKQEVRLFVEGKAAAIGSVDVYSLPDGAHLFIGLSAAKADDKDGIRQESHPQQGSGRRPA